MQTLQQVMQTMAKNIRTKRLDLGLTPAQLAKKAGVSTSTIRRLESGLAQNTYLDTLGKIIKVLHITLNEVFSEKE